MELINHLSTNSHQSQSRKSNRSKGDPDSTNFMIMKSPNEFNNSVQTKMHSISAHNIVDQPDLTKSQLIHQTNHDLDKQNGETTMFSLETTIHDYLIMAPSPELTRLWIDVFQIGKKYKNLNFN